MLLTVTLTLTPTRTPSLTLTVTVTVTKTLTRTRTLLLTQIAKAQEVAVGQDDVYEGGGGGGRSSSNRSTDGAGRSHVRGQVTYTACLGPFRGQDGTSTRPSDRVSVLRLS